MQRITIAIDDNLPEEIDAAAKASGYQNRSEIIRDLARMPAAECRRRPPPKADLTPLLKTALRLSAARRAVRRDERDGRRHRRSAHPAGGTDNSIRSGWSVR